MEKRRSSYTCLMNACLVAFAIVFDAVGRVLLAHRRDMDFWNPPGGGAEDREPPGTRWLER